MRMRKMSKNSKCNSDAVEWEGRGEERRYGIDKTVVETRGSPFHRFQVHLDPGALVSRHSAWQGEGNSDRRAPSSALFPVQNTMLSLFCALISSFLRC